MRSFRHRRGRILFEIFAAVLLDSLAVERWVEGGSIIGLVAASVLTLYAVYRSIMLFARNPALAYGQRGVRVGGVLKIRDYQWSEVRDIRETVWTRPYIPFMHFIPKQREYIEFHVGSEKIRLRPEMMELPPEGMKEIIRELKSAQVAALGERGAAVARLGGNPVEQRPAASGVQAERLQRLGLGTTTAETEASDSRDQSPAPARQIYAPQQRGFGRKAS